MHASNPMTSTQLPIARIRSTHGLFALVRREIHHLLLIIDPASRPELALTIALEVAERWGSQITVVHAGRLSGWRTSAEQSSETALRDLLCLSWQMQGGNGEISISHTLPASLGEVVEEAAERNADLILLSEPLAARFHHPELTMSSGSCGAAFCPIVIVGEPESD